jgi:hypothetical protein
VGLNIKGLDKNNMPRSGDVMVYKKDTTLGQTREFAAQIQVLDIPNEIKCGYSPIGFVRCGRSACRISKLTWKMGKETGGKKMEELCVKSWRRSRSLLLIASSHLKIDLEVFLNSCLREIFSCIQRCSTTINYIARYSIVFVGIQWYIQRYVLVLNSMRKHSVVFAVMRSHLL